MRGRPGLRLEFITTGGRGAAVVVEDVVLFAGARHVDVARLLWLRTWFCSRDATDPTETYGTDRRVGVLDSGGGFSLQVDVARLLWSRMWYWVPWPCYRTYI